MKSRTNRIMEDCLEQSQKFIKWDSKKSWNTFHSSHYDWWAFPIDKPSMSMGTTYKVGEIQLRQLKSSQQFIKALRINSILVCKSWGWNLEEGKNIKNCQKNQMWQRWPIRLSKMCRSLEIFEQLDLFKNCIIYANNLLKDFKKFTYGRSNLTPYFEEKMHEISKLKIANENQQKVLSKKQQLPLLKQDQKLKSEIIKDQSKQAEKKQIKESKIETKI